MMASFVVVCLILAEILMVQALAEGSNVGSDLNPPRVMLQTGVEPHGVASGSVADHQPASSPAGSSEGREYPGGAEAPEIRRLGKHHADKSVAGGGVIIGGLVTAIFAAVFCYIRVTRKTDGDHQIHH